jgi:cell division septation protein DedD
VYAGRSLGERELADEERVVRLPVAPAAEEAPVRDDDLTFDDTLSGGDRAGARAPSASAGAHPPAEVRAPVEVPAFARERHAPPGGAAPAAPALAAGPPDGGAARPGEEGPARGAGEGPGRAAEGPSAHAAVPGGGRGPGASAPGASGASSASSASGAGAEGGAGVRSPEARIAVALAGPANAGSASPLAGGVWSVQVTATREAQTAADMVRRLRAKGYDAYIVKARRQGSTFYRVRVGHFPSMEHASQMVSRLRREPGVPEAFVASD